ncbi:MAG: FAD-dependent oxidoreductase [Ruminococcaceae bacterium]|nr:FAD-dependent oxidoreductase [Oscillospiraceae bacterium]
MRNISYITDLCVVGGGMSGLCCAIAAARHGIKVVLVQDRPVLGGNASSEIRMWIGGAHGKDNREGGIIEEIFLENFYQNPSLKYPIWDSVLYEKAMAEENLTLLLNTSCLDAVMDGTRIVSIKAWQSNAETFHTVFATYFADCSGDSILAPLTGAKFMYGREAKNEFGETIPPDTADKKTMGMSCLFQIRETDHKVDFVPPKWAYKYESDDDLPYKDHDKNSNFWWIELGGEWDCIHDTDRCRDELLKICYGVWDHMKNHGDHGVENWELEWIGFLPGKRESRRYVGKYIVTQNDVEAEGHFDDIVAYAGWTMDDHFPEGFYYTKGHPTIYHKAPQPWGLPLRCMISENIDNLVFAGRNISVTHAALSSSRVMATCAILGQALGTAVAQSINDNCPVEDVNISRLQQTLMADDCYIPWHQRSIPALTREAKCSSDVVRSGIDRGGENLWIGKDGDSIIYEFDADTEISEIRLVFDNDMNRKYHNMPCNYPLVQTKFKLPSTLIKEYKIEGENSAGDKLELSVCDNYQRFVRHRIDWKVKKISFIPISTHGCDDFRVFDFEIK